MRSIIIVDCIVVVVKIVERSSSSLSERKRYCVARRPSVTLSRCVCVRRINLGVEGNALYPVLCRYKIRKKSDFSSSLIVGLYELIAAISRWIAAVLDDVSIIGL